MIIGNHFSEVNDQLTNFLQLANNHSKSELLLASIEQKANRLQPIPFGKAINFSANKKYLPLAVIPILFILFFYFSGNDQIISQSLHRIVHYNQKFVPPAPFDFEILNSKLQTQKQQDFVLKLKTVGSIIPENVTIHIGDESYFLEQLQPGEFEYTIVKPTRNVLFHVEANGIKSVDYELQVVQVPSIANFEMELIFPSYLNKKPSHIVGSGNAVVPEGTRIQWKLATVATQKVVFKEENQISPFVSTMANFSFSKAIFKTFGYQIITSNSNVKDYENLEYQIEVIKDQLPTIQAAFAPDSLKMKSKYVLGQLADDYGLHKLQIVYYEHHQEKSAKRGTIPLKGKTVDQFVFSFPANLPVEQGKVYDYYFEVFDNDALHGFKSAKSVVFSSRISTDEEQADQILQQQSENLTGLQKSLKEQSKQFSALDKLQQLGKEKQNFDFKEQQNVNDFIQRQKKQDELMKQFADKLKENLDDFKSKKSDAFKDELKKRLDETKKDLEQNEKLLNELKALNDKIKNEELLNKLDNFKQNSKNQTKSLEQLVELTKKYYVEKKAEQLAEKLESLSKKQDNLADNPKSDGLEKQGQINKDFDALKEDLQDLSKENKQLKSPLDLHKEDAEDKSIDEDLNIAKTELEKNAASKAKPKQKSAAQKMKSLAQKMKQSVAMNEQEQLEEDVKMLRQILDNLLAFSLSQEDLMKQFRNIKSGSPSLNRNIKVQQNLKTQFKHVDDSLFAMSLRNPKIAEDITKEIGNIQYNMDKALDNFTNSQLSKGISHQQYTIASANVLGDFLSSILSSMQMSLSGASGGKPKPGKGEGEGMQLPDIIKKQQGLGDKIKQGMQPNESGSDGKDGKSGKGSSSDKGADGKEGEGDAKAILEIYKEQQQLRESLENELKQHGLSRNGGNVLEQMKQIEKQLLNKGFTNELLQKVLNVKQELLKLETAVQEQNQDTKRQAETTKKEFQNRSNALPNVLLDYLNSIEILNRQSLPLRSNFEQKVQEYFNNK
ncbi:ATPase [Flavobacterium sp. UMI-01]|nr:ATPase [Flavobacterium sp. UMI-01]